MVLELYYIVLYLSVSTACAYTYRRAKSASRLAPNPAEFLVYIALLTVSTILVFWTRTWEPDASVSKRTFVDTVLLLNTIFADGILLWRSSIISQSGLALGGCLYASNIMCGYIMLHQISQSETRTDFTTAWLAVTFAFNILFASGTSPSIGHALSRFYSPQHHDRQTTWQARETTMILWDGSSLSCLTSLILKAAFTTRIRTGASGWDDNDLVWLLFGGITGLATAIILLRVAIGWAYDKGWAGDMSSESDALVNVVEDGPDSEEVRP